MPTPTMPSLDSVLEELKQRGAERTRATYIRHGMPAERVLGVSVADLKIVAKTIKGCQAFTYDLYDTGYMEAMYLAGMVADGSKMTVEKLDAWAHGTCGIAMIANYTIPWVTIEHPDACKLAVKWIDAREDAVQSAGWSTYSGIVTVRSDDKLDLPEIERLLAKIATGIHGAPNLARSAMNTFVITVGTYVAPLHQRAIEAAESIGAVYVDHGDTACKTSVASDAIQKVGSLGKVGQKRKTIRC